MQSTSKWHLAASLFKMASAVPHLPQYSDGTRLQHPTALTLYQTCSLNSQVGTLHILTLLSGSLCMPPSRGTTQSKRQLHFCSRWPMAHPPPLPAHHPAVVLLAATQRFTACLNDIH